MFHSTGCNILMLEYRGYGLNSGYRFIVLIFLNVAVTPVGAPSQAGLELDALAALDFVRARRDLLSGANRQSLRVYLFMRF